MRQRLASLTAVATGALVLRLVLSHGHTAYVKPSAGPLLLVAAAVLLLAGGAGLVSTGADGHVPPRVAGLLVVPAVLLVVVAPPSLGAFYAQHAGSSAVVARPGDGARLVAGPDGTTALSIAAAVRRGVLGDTLQGSRIRLTGFVSGKDGLGRLLLTRFSVKCCAADATASTVALVTGSRVATDDWVEVTGSVQSVEGRLPVLEVDRLVPVEEPEDPYEA